MERSLRIKRIYAVGNYQNIEVEDRIDNIPEKLVLDSTAMDLLSNLLLCRIESIYQKYVTMRQTFSDKQPEEVQALLEDTQAELYSKLDKHLTKE